MDLTTIVVGFDGSENARLALDAAIGLAGEHTTIHVVTAYEPPSTVTFAELVAQIPDEFRSTIDPIRQPRNYLDQAEQILAESGVNYEGHLVNNRPASAILDTAESTGADLIVVGSRGIGRGRRFLRGSVSSRIAAHAPISFLVVHEHDAEPE